MKSRASGSMLAGTSTVDLSPRARTLRLQPARWPSVDTATLVTHARAPRKPGCMCLWTRARVASGCEGRVDALMQGACTGSAVALWQTLAERRAHVHDAARARDAVPMLAMSSRRAQAHRNTHARRRRGLHGVCQGAHACAGSSGTCATLRVAACTRLMHHADVCGYMRSMMYR